MKYEGNDLWKPESDKDVVYSGIIFFRYLLHQGTVMTYPDLQHPADGEVVIDMHDDPAVFDDCILRFKNGLLDGGDKPAVECPETGHAEYWKNGRLHRDDGLPAVITNSGDREEYWLDGTLQYIKCSDDLALFVRPDFTVIEQVTDIKEKRKLGW